MMNGKKAKALRKRVCGDLSHRGMEYALGHEPAVALGWARTIIPTCLCLGLRRAYQEAKKGKAYDKT